MARALLDLLLAAALLAPAPRAQAAEPGAQETPKSDPLWAAICQQQDGRFHDTNGPSDLRTTSLVCLALLAEGNTMKYGPQREAVRKAYAWLRSGIDEQGRIHRTAAKDRPLDHLLATWTLGEIMRLSHYRPANAGVIEALGAAARLCREQPQALGSDELLVATLAARACRTAPADADAVDAAAAELERALPAQPSLPTPRFSTPHTRAADLLRDALRIEVGTDPKIDPRRIEAARPLDLREDPLTTLWFTAALCRIGGQPLRDWSPSLGTLAKDGLAGGPAWSAPPAAAHGALGTEALRRLTVAMWHRAPMLAFAE